MSLLRRLLGLFYLLCVPAGVLWALSPLGVRLSEYGLKTPNVFWKLFVFVPVLMLVGLVGVYLFELERRTLLEKAGFVAASVGALLVIVGDVGLYYLRLDDVFLMSAPFYRAFRAGLVVLAAGTMVFAVGAARSRNLPVWGALPLAIASLAGVISASEDLGGLGAGMWIAFGAGWAWLGAAIFLRNVAAFLKKRRASKTTSVP